LIELGNGRPQTSPCVAPGDSLSAYIRLASPIPSHYVKNMTSSTKPQVHIALSSKKDRTTATINM